jgi:hypothetical protein
LQAGQNPNEGHSREPLSKEYTRAVEKTGQPKGGAEWKSVLSDI